MALQYSVALRTAQVAQIETTAGTSPKLKLYSGAQPANCAAAASGTLLADIALPVDWLTAASAGAVTLNGTWTGTGAAAGTIGHFRITDTAGTIPVVMQGSVTATGGGGDMTVDNTSIAVGQTFTVNTFSITAGNA